MSSSAEKRGQIIRLLEQAFALADELDDGATGYLIERALDEARARQFKINGALKPRLTPSCGPGCLLRTEPSFAPEPVNPRGMVIALAWNVINAFARANAYVPLDRTPHKRWAKFQGNGSDHNNR
jgi:hypothetical protein